MSDSSKVIKASLKSAREKIDSRDWRGALKDCKKVLNVDKNHYMALVFCGLCLTELEQLDQAVTAYGKAVESVPDQLPGWQGLLKIFEGKVNNKAVAVSDIQKAEKECLELEKIYRNITRICQAEDQVDKVIQTSTKLSLLHANRLNDLNAAIMDLHHRIDFLSNGAVEDGVKSSKILQTHEEIVRLLKDRELSDEHNRELLKSLEKVVSKNTSIQNMENYKLYLRLLYKMRKMADLARASIEMHNVFPGDNVPLEWACKLYIEWSAGETLSGDEFEVIFQNVQDLVEKLLALSPNSILGKMSKAILLYKAGSLMEAKNQLSAAVFDKLAANLYAVLVLCQVCLKLGDDHTLQKCVEKSHILLPDRVKEEEVRVRISGKLASMQLDCYYRQSKYEKAATLLPNDFDLCDSDLVYKGCVILTQLGQLQKATSLLDKIPADDDKLMARALIAHKKGRFEDCMTLLGEVKEDFCEKRLLMGETLWGQGRENDSLGHFLMAAKLNPTNWMPFYRLGKFYQREGPKMDLEKSKKCLLKSLNLNPSSPLAGSSLSDIYRAQGQFDANLEFLTSVTSSHKEQGWAHLRLGLNYLATQQHGKAIVSLYSVLKSEPNNVEAWESLADAYAARGSFQAATKAYEKTIDLLGSELSAGPDGLYPRLQVATINYKTGHYDIAIKQLDEILHIDVNGNPKNKYVPALKILAEALLARARIELEEYLDSSAMDNCRLAIKHLGTAVLEAAASTTSGSVSQLSCLWKLISDCCMMVHDLPEAATVLSELPSEVFTSPGVDEKPLSILDVSIKCIVRALQLDADNANLWHDLADTYFALATQLSHDENVIKSDEAETKCLWAIKKSIALDPNNHAHWNALGVYAMSMEKEDYALAQHCFAKSVHLENNAVAWTNLGVLYFILGDQTLTNQAFKEAQGQDPLYPQGWVGQALLAEQMGFGDESLDLFRHVTSHLGQEPESHVGYGNWIMRTLAKMGTEEQGVGNHGYYCVRNMQGVTVASDCLLRYIRRYSRDPGPLNTLGILLEREDLLRTSMEVLRNALDLTSDPGQKNSVLMNIGRVAMKMGSWEKAVAHFELVEESGKDLWCLLGLALSYDKVGNSEKAYEFYRRAFESKDASDHQKSQVLTAMALIAHRVHGAAAAKTLLLKASQLHPVAINALFALCVVGLRHSDLNLVTASLQEMEKYQGVNPLMNLDQHLPDITSLRSLVYELKGNVAAARRVLVSAVHTYPHLSKLWSKLSLHLMEHDQSNTKSRGAATKCLQGAVLLDRHSAQEQSMRPEVSILEGSQASGRQGGVELSCLLALSHVVNNDHQMAMKAASSAVHSYPHSPMAWSVMAAALGLPGPTSIKQDNLKSMAVKSAYKCVIVQSESKLHQWISQQLPNSS